MVRPLAALTLVALFSTAGAQITGPDWVPGLVSAEEAAEGFYPLFNGADLSGWSVLGQDKNAIAIRDGLLVLGRKPESGLASDQLYENFVMRYEYRAPETRARSSVFVRMPTVANPPDLLEVQPEVPTASEKPVGEWNEIEVVCRDSRIRSVMNGLPLYDINVDTAFAAPGRIAIFSGAQPYEVRRMRIKPLPGGVGWGPLLNDAEPGDFELRFAFKPSTGAIGSVLFRGYEVRIDNTAAEDFTGSIAGIASALELRALDNCWNAMHIVARGRNVQVVVNGKKVLDFISARKGATRPGRIELEDGGGNMQFKEVEMKPISQEHA